MIKPRWLLAGVALLGSAGLAGAIVVASPGGEEEIVRVESATPTASVQTSSTPTGTPQPSFSPDTPPTESPAATPTTAAGDVLFRWADVTLVFTPGAGVIPFPTWVGPDIKPPSGGPAIEIIRHRDGTNTSGVFVDADTGAVLVENMRDDDRLAMDAVLKTVTVAPLDRSTAAWPYNGDPGPDPVRRHSSRISFVAPAPSTGLHVYEGSSLPGGPFVSMKNERSSAVVYVDAATGVTSIDRSGLLAEDGPVFDRWLAALKRCDIEIQC